MLSTTSLVSGSDTSPQWYEEEAGSRPSPSFLRSSCPTVSEERKSESELMFSSSSRCRPCETTFVSRWTTFNRPRSPRQCRCKMPAALDPVRRIAFFGDIDDTAVERDAEETCDDVLTQLGRGTFDHIGVGGGVSSSMSMSMFSILYASQFTMLLKDRQEVSCCKEVVVRRAADTALSRPRTGTGPEAY